MRSYISIQQMALVLAIGFVSIFTFSGVTKASEPVEISLLKGKSQVVELDSEITTLVVSDEKIADVFVINPKSFYVLGKNNGSTNIQVLMANNGLQYIYELTVGVDTALVTKAIKDALPKAKVSVKNIGDRLSLSGVVDSEVQRQRALEIASAFSSSIVDSMRIAPPEQVYVMVKFVEVSSNKVQTFGGDASLLFSLSSEGAASILDTTLDLNSTISSLINNGQARYLAAPTLTALSGTTSSFLAGGEIPIQTVSATGESAVTFKEYGVRLTFSPQITDYGKILITLDPEVSQIDQAFSTEAGAALSTRKASTTAELKSGESIMIAGLLQSSSSRGSDGEAILGELPIIGPMFRKSSLKETNTELLIIVTPTLSRPTKTMQGIEKTIAQSELTSGQEFFLDGKIERSRYSIQDLLAGKGISGSFGHVLSNESNGILRSK